MIYCFQLFSFLKALNCCMMKIEIEVNDELVAKVGIDTLKAYLLRKVEQMENKMQQPSDGLSTVDEAEQELLQKAWSNFNKRGISC